MQEPDIDIEVIERMKEPVPELLRDAPDGEVRAVVFYPDERLAQVSEEVTPAFFGEELDKLVSDMATTMYMTGGMGLSAIQVGVPLRVFICDITAMGGQVPRGMPQNQLLVAVNPSVAIPEDAKTTKHMEGCLSFPGVHEVVERPDDVILRARDRKGNVYTLSTGGAQGRVILHEMDHLDGKTFLDRMKPLARANAEKGIAQFHRAVDRGSIRVGGPGPKETKPAPSAAARKRARKKRKKSKRR